MLDADDDDSVVRAAVAGELDLDEETRLVLLHRRLPEGATRIAEVLVNFDTLTSIGGSSIVSWHSVIEEYAGEGTAYADLFLDPTDVGALV